MSDDSGNYFTECVACGEMIEVKNKIRSKHTCAEKREAARKSAHTRAHDAIPRRAAFGERLATGFEMLDEDDSGDDE